MTDADAVTIRCTINGHRWEGTVPPETILLDLLRDQLDLRGTKRGCERMACGACTVLVDGRPVSACGMLAVDIDSASVLTVEGLAADGSPTPLQQAFIDKVAAQCGYCTPGQIMNAVALTGAAGERTRDQVRDWMQANLCRCGSYGGILEAIDAALAQADQ